MHDPTPRSRCRRTLLRRPRWLPTRERGNGLGDDAWVPVMFISRRVISAVLAELGRAGVPAYCARFNPAWCGIPARWCLWVGRSANGRAEERLTEVMLGLFGDLGSGPSAALPRRSTTGEGTAWHLRPEAQGVTGAQGVWMGGSCRFPPGLSYLAAIAG
jgi:hypothetical protein